MREAWAGCPHQQAVSGRESPSQTQRRREWTGRGQLGGPRTAWPVGGESGTETAPRARPGAVLCRVEHGSELDHVGEDWGPLEAVDVTRCPWAVSKHLVVTPGLERRLHVDRPAPGWKRGPGAHGAADSRGRSGWTAWLRTPLRRGRRWQEQRGERGCLERRRPPRREAGLSPGGQNRQELRATASAPASRQGATYMLRAGSRPHGLWP